MLRLIRGMGLVAGFAAASLDIFVDVQIMKIQLAIAEIGESLGFFVQSDVFVMTLEAGGIVFGFVGHIEFFGEVLAKNPIVLASMRAVAGVTITLLNRPVLMVRFGKRRPHFLVTREAKLGLGNRKQARIFRGMDIVALRASTLRNRLMWYAVRRQITVTTKAKPRLLSSQQVL